MKKNLLLLLLMLPSLFAFGQGLEKVYVEEIPVPVEAGLAENSVTYRVFLDMAPDFGFVNVFGNENHVLTIKTTTEFYNDALGVAAGDLLNPALIEAFPNVIYDSWVSAGATASNRIGVPVTVDQGGYVEGEPVPVSLSPGLDLSMFGTATSAQPFMTQNGLWSGLVFGGVKYPVASPDNMVLIGQFTTNGVFSFELNIDLLNPETEKKTFVARDPLSEDNEVYIPSLAGVYGPGINAPQVAISAPADGSRFLPDQPISITAEASDDVGVDSVLFLIDQQLAGIDDSAPFILDYQSVKEGQLELVAVAFDTDGANAVSEPVYIIISAASSNAPPLVEIKLPGDGSVRPSGSDILIRANASDTDGIVDSVEFYINGSKEGVDQSGTETSGDALQYEYTWTGMEGPAEIRVVAWDNSGDESADTVNILVNSPPEVEFTAPAEGAIFTEGETVSLQMNATDSDGTIDKVELILADVLIASISDAPYTYDWVSTEGAATFVAKAWDNLQYNSTDTLHITVDEEVSVNDLYAGDHWIRVYPNPVGNFLHVDLAAEIPEKRIRMEMIDLTGRRHLELQLQSGIADGSRVLDLSDLPAGAYFLKASAGKEIRVIKILKH